MCLSQSLIANGSFEEVNICTEYKMNCAPEAWLGNTGGFKNYIYDSQFCFVKNYCLTLEAGRTRNKYQRTYTRTQLLCNLRKGNKYNLSFFIKAYTNVLDSIGIHFTTYDFIFEKKPLHAIIPSAYIIDENILKHDSSWQRVSFLYTATGDEKYLTIANFSKRDINGETGVINENHFYVYIDAVALKPVDSNEQMCLDWQKVKSEIYVKNDRHEYLERYIRFYRTKSKWAPSPKLSLTQIYNMISLTVPDTFFFTGKEFLRMNGFALLDSFCSRVIALKIDSLIVEGHTDDKRYTIYTNSLFMQRAATVGKYICTKIGLKPKLFVLKNSSAATSVSDYTTHLERQRNRRVEVRLYRSM